VRVVAATMVLVVEKGVRVVVEGKGA